ncbi:MAG: hypothetical protein SGJ27_01685 [Candidatus Melainabacteria bacterium]|nr:hypothetical protein [Candidatus Melainabacteria bacterium]
MKSSATTGGIKAAALAVLSTFLLCACEDPRRVSWSPDGKTVAVIAGDGLRISDSEGSVGEPKTGVELINWFPDSRHLLTVEYEKLTSWQMIQKHETAEDLKGAIDTAGKMLVQAKTTKGDMDKFGEAIKNLPYTREAVVYLRERKDKEMVANFGDKWTSVKNTVDVGLHNICSYDVSSKTFSDRKQIYSTMRDVKEVRLSPHGKAFLLVYKQELDDQLTLDHVTFNTATSTSVSNTISGAAAIYPDWAPDGSAFYYVEEDRTANPETVDSNFTPTLGSLHSLNVNPESDDLVTSRDNRILAKMIFRKNCRVRALKDGRVIFSAMPAQLPSSDSQLLNKQTLFVVRPNENVLVAPMVPMETFDSDTDLVEFFDVNPSGKMVSIPSTKEGVFVYNVLTGDAARVSGGGFSWTKRLSFIPSWRNEDELCLGMKEAKPDQTIEKSDIVLWSPGKETPRILSGNWPASAKRNFLEANPTTGK